MSNINVTILVPTALVVEARHIADCIDHAAHGMYVTALERGGVVLWYVNAGAVDDRFIAVLNDPVLMFQAAHYGASQQELECTATLEICEQLIAESIVDYGDPWELFASMGLGIYQEPLV